MVVHIRKHQRCTFSLALCLVFHQHLRSAILIRHLRQDYIVERDDMDYSFYGFAVGEAWPMPTNDVIRTYLARNSSSVPILKSATQEKDTIIKKTREQRQQHNIGNKQSSSSVRRRFMADSGEISGRLSPSWRLRRRSWHRKDSEQSSGSGATTTGSSTPTI